jgi:hypothetical protein
MTIGCDPEFFLRDRKRGKLVSAIPFVDGTKEEPKVLPLGGNIQRDNVAVEVATDPADSMDRFIANIRNTLTEAVKTLPEDTEIVAVPSATFDADQLEHPEAQRFGCDPDYDAWEVVQNEPPCASDASFRSCGAHIHVGTTGEDENAFLIDFKGKIDTVKGMDCIHGIVSTILDAGEDAIARRQLYGKPGAHRPKDYGVEYRVLSNYWLKSPVTVMMMYHLTQDALKVVREGKIDGLIEAIGEAEVKNIITAGDVEAATKVMDDHIMPLLSEESIHYYNEALSKIKANNIDFHAEWGLYGKEIAA